MVSLENVQTKSALTELATTTNKHPILAQNIATNSKMAFSNREWVDKYINCTIKLSESKLNCEHNFNYNLFA